MFCFYQLGADKAINSDPIKRRSFVALLYGSGYGRRSEIGRLTKSSDLLIS